MEAPGAAGGLQQSRPPPLLGASGRLPALGRGSPQPHGDPDAPLPSRPPRRAWGTRSEGDPRSSRSRPGGRTDTRAGGSPGAPEAPDGAAVSVCQRASSAALRPGSAWLGGRGAAWPAPGLTARTRRPGCSLARSLARPPGLQERSVLAAGRPRLPSLPRAGGAFQPSEPSGPPAPRPRLARASPLPAPPAAPACGPEGGQKTGVGPEGPPRRGPELVTLSLL